MKWTFVRNINNMGEDGIVDIHSLTILCLCHEEQSKIILDALSLPSDKMEWVDVKTRLPEEITGKIIFRQASTKIVLSLNTAKDWIEDNYLHDLEWLYEPADKKLISFYGNP